MMPHPPAEDFSEEGARKPKVKPGLIPFFGVSRTRMMGSRGLGAASIGWTLAGCILVGFGAGAWLDKRLGTTYWTPILFLVGVVAGFREMFRTLAQVNKAPRESLSRGSQLSSTPSPRASSPAAGSNLKPEPGAVEASQAPRQRLFAVPPPPFMQQPSVGAGQQRELNSQEIKRRLLGLDEAEVPEGEEKGDAV